MKAVSIFFTVSKSGTFGILGSMAMRWQKLVLVLVVSGSVADLASAGIFSRKPKPTAQRAQELVVTLKSDADDGKRASAADELNQYDPKSNPEIVPALLAAVQDSKPEVRAAAVQTLGKLRPVSQEVGAALEQTLANDGSIKVRIQARTTLWQYYIAGYRKSDGPVTNGPTTQEPPLADPALTNAQPPPAATPPSVPEPQPASRFRPLFSPASKSATPAPARPATAPVKSANAPAAAGRPVPATPPVLNTPPPLLDAPSNSGPELNPPQ